MNNPKPEPSAQPPQTRGPDGAHQEVRGFKRGDLIEGVYLLSKLDVRKTKNGDDFFAFELSDRTGSIPGRQWEASPDAFPALSDAPVVYATGVVDEWMNELQLKVTGLEPIEASVEELRFLIPHTPFDTEQLFEELKACFETLERPHLRELFRKVWEDEAFVRRLKEVPAASSYHHSYMGGLLEHIVSLLRASEQMLHAYPRLDRDLVLVGAFLHDIGKVEELSWERGFSYTTRGQLLGHIAIGTLLVEEWTRKVEGFPAQLRDELIHLVLAHHGLREHGSPVVPVTPEALVVHFLDNLDGKLWSCFKAIDDRKSGDAAWSPYSKHMGRRIYREGRDTPEPEESPELRVERPAGALAPLDASALAPRARVSPADALRDEALRARAPEERSRARAVRSRDRTPPLFG